MYNTIKPVIKNTQMHIIYNIHIALEQMLNVCKMSVLIVIFGSGPGHS